MDVLEVFHHEQVAVVELNVEDLLGPSVSDFEGSARAKAEARDAACVNSRLVVPVPSHGVLPVSVSIDQDTVVRRAC